MTEIEESALLDPILHFPSWFWTLLSPSLPPAPEDFDGPVVQHYSLRTHLPESMGQPPQLITFLTSFESVAVTEGP